MNKEQFEELCAAYALGALEPDELKVLKDALRDGGPEYEAIFRSFTDTAMQLSLATDSVEVPPGIKQKVMSRITQKTTVTPISVPWLRAAALLLVGICMVLGYISYNLGEKVGTLETVVEQQRLEMLNLEDRLLASERYLDIISSRNTYLVSMDGLEPSPSGFGRLFLDSASGSAVLQVAELPATPSDKDYQLWIIRDDVPVSAGIFSLETDMINQFLTIEDFVEDDINQIAAIAITLEPKGGMPQPTGSMYLIGSP